MKNRSVLFVMALLLAVVGCGDDKEKAPSCGDGIKEGIEKCDDGNILDGDGCSSTCQTESSSTPSNPVCGDGKKEGSEACDDGNKTDGDGCSATCTVENNNPSTTECPNKGSSCTEPLSSLCCDGKLYYCDLDFQWHMQECLTGTICETIAVDFGDDYPDQMAQCAEPCDAAEVGKVMDYGTTCYEDDTFDLYVCTKTKSGNYVAARSVEFAKSYCIDNSNMLTCNAEGNVEEAACNSCELVTDHPLYITASCASEPDNGTPKAGDDCSEEDDGMSVCGQNNTRLECTKGTYELIEKCIELGENYYCDVKADDEFVACVAPCDASQKGQVTGYYDCLFGYVMVSTCELGKSGQYGDFGGLPGEQVCSLDGTKLMTCNESGAFVETSCAAGCSMTWDDQESAFFAACN